MQPNEQENLYQSPDGPNQAYQETSQEFDQAPVSVPGISWQASEYIQHDKDSIWFLALAGITLLLLLVDFFLIKSWTFGALIVVMAVGVVVFARRPPRVINYTLTPDSLRVDEKQFSLQDFRAFGVLQEEAVNYIRLTPVKRFMPAVNIYFPDEYGEQIVDFLGSQLPMESIEPDFIDRLTQKIRF